MNIQQHKFEASFEGNSQAKYPESKSVSVIQEPSPEQQQLIQAFLFRIKSDRSYEIAHQSIKLLRAAPFYGLNPNTKYKPQYFAFRCWNKVTESSIIFMKVQKKFKIYADRLYFQIGRSKYRNLAQIIDIFPDFIIPEMFGSPKSKYFGNQSQIEQSVEQRSDSDSKFVTPSSWADQQSDYFWIASQDFANSKDIDTEQTLWNIITDQANQTDIIDNSGFEESEFIFWAKQLSSSLAQMQVLGKPHGNIQPRAFGVKCNKILKLRNLFDDECQSQEGLRSCKMSLVYGNAFWLDYQEQKLELSPYKLSKAKGETLKKVKKRDDRKWGFKDDALALGRILLQMMLIGIAQPQQTQKILLSNFQKYRNEYTKVESTLKSTQQLVIQTEKEAISKLINPIRLNRKFNQKLITIVLKLVEPDQNQRLDAVGAFYNFQTFQDLDDFTFEQQLMKEVAAANERCQRIGKLVGNNIKLQISLNRSNKIRNYFQTPPNQQNQDMNDSSLIEDWFDPQEFLDSYQHRALMKQKDRTLQQVKKVRQRVDEVVKRFEKLNTQFQAMRDKQQQKPTFKKILKKSFKIDKSLNGYHKLQVQENQSKSKDQIQIYKQTYSGNLKQGKKQGFGILQNQDFLYIGQFLDDKIHGVGNKTYRDQKFKDDEYVGEFEQGDREGYGHYISNHGQQIYGQWQKDLGISYQYFEKRQFSQKFGKEKLIERYQGKRSKNAYHGFGILQKFQKQNQTAIGKFQNDVINGYGRHQIGSNGQHYYEGNLKKSIYNGFGCLVTGSSYVIGSFQDGQQLGWCTARMQNGSYYIGQIARDKFNGFGVFIEQDTLQYNGQFLNDQRAGKGRMIVINESEYVGGFREDKIHGYGIKIMYDKWSYEGFFDKGKRQGLGTEVIDKGDLHKQEDESFDQFEAEKLKIDSQQRAN